MRNQTEDLWLIGQTPTDLGISLCLAGPNFVPGRPAIQLLRSATLYKFLITDINYPDAVEFGNKPGIFVFKWIPPTIADLRTLQSASPCDGSVLCTDRCARIACGCKDGRCV